MRSESRFLYIRVDEKTRDAFEGNVALTDAKADAFISDDVFKTFPIFSGTFDPRRGNRVNSCNGPEGW